VQRTWETKISGRGLGRAEFAIDDQGKALVRRVSRRRGSLSSCKNQGDSQSFRWGKVSAAAPKERGSGGGKCVQAQTPRGGGVQKKVRQSLDIEGKNPHC